MSEDPPIASPVATAPVVETDPRDNPYWVLMECPTCGHQGWTARPIPSRSYAETALTCACVATVAGVATGLIAVVFGILAMRQRDGGPWSSTARRMGLAGLILGLFFSVFGVMSLFIIDSVAPGNPVGRALEAFGEIAEKIRTAVGV